MSTNTLDDVNNKSSTLKILLDTPTDFFTNVNDKVFKDSDKNTEGTDLKKGVKMYLTILLTIFLTLFLIFSLTTSIVSIIYYNEICSNNYRLKDEMNIVYYLAIFNIIFIFLFIVLFILLYLKDFISNKIINYINDWKIIYWVGLLISIINMVISSKYIIILSKCNFETNHLSNYLWINYTITLPIYLLIYILNIFYNKIK